LSLASIGFDHFYGSVMPGKIPFFITYVDPISPPPKFAIEPGEIENFERPAKLT